MASILIIEKEDPAMHLLAWGLTQEGYTVATASDPELVGAKDALKPDVIVLNTGMSRDIKRLWVSTLRYLVEGVRVIDLTSDANDSTDSGADAYLTAPYRIDNLVEVMQRLQPRNADDVLETK